MARPEQVLARQTTPGFDSAWTVLLAMGVLYVILSGLWQRIGPAWRTLAHGGAGPATPTLPVVPKIPALPEWPKFLPDWTRPKP